LRQRLDPVGRIRDDRRPDVVRQRLDERSEQRARAVEPGEQHELWRRMHSCMIRPRLVTGAPTAGPRVRDGMERAGAWVVVAIGMAIVAAVAYFGLKRMAPEPAPALLPQAVAPAPPADKPEVRYPVAAG